MSSLLRLVHLVPACTGRHATLRVTRAPVSVDLAVAGLMAEIEADDVEVRSVTVEVDVDADVEAAAITRWLAHHGRRVLLRVARPPSRELIGEALPAEALVLLPIAHSRPAIQQALLGPHAADPKALLLAAQHLRTVGLTTVAEVGPLFSGVHDRVGGIDAVAKMVRSAAIERAALRLGSLWPAQLVALRQVHDAGGIMDLCRVHDVPVRALFGDQAWPSDQRWPMPRLSAAGLSSTCARVLRDQGLSLSGCGCPGHCTWARGTPNYIRVGAGDLFSRAPSPTDFAATAYETKPQHR